MSRFGWAFVNDIVTGSGGTPGGSDKQIQFNSGSTFSGSTNLTFDYGTNTLYLTGTLRADNLIVSSSQILKSGSTIFGDDISDTHQFTGSVLGGIVSGTIARFIVVTGSTITGSTGLFGVVTSSAFSGGSFVGTTISGTTAEFTIISGSTVTGSTGLFTTLTASEGFVSGGLIVGNYIQMLPVGNVAIPTNQTASYIYTSGSTNDIYFTQYEPGSNFNNTTRLRWLEGALSTGLLHGGILSTVTGTTSFNLSSGSGVIINYNATLTEDPYPTIQYVQWNSFVSQSLIYSASNQITYVAIDSSGTISQTNSAFTSQQFKDRIIIGRVLHQTGAVTNGVINTPTTAYGITSNTQDFFRAFGPLKISGQVLEASGTTTLAITRTAGDSYVEGRNYTTNPNIPNYVFAVDDPALTTTKIFYSWVSGSTVNIDTNGGAGYTALIPNRYNLNGTVTTITPTNKKYTVQRIYWFPKSVTRALFAYYGSTIYTTLSDAITAISDEPNFTEGDNTRGSAVYIGAVVMEADSTNFTDPTKTKIVNGGLFRASSNGGGGGGGTTTPGGSNTEIQFNDSGVFNGSPNFTFNTVTSTLSLTGSFNMVGTGSLDIDGGFITGSLARFETITGSTITGSTALFTTITASSISAFGPNQSIQYNNAGVLNGSSNLTFDGTQVRLTGSLAVISGSTIVAEAFSSGFRTTGKPIQVRNAGSIIVGVMDENGTISGSIGRYTTITSSVVTASTNLLVGTNATIGGNILGSGGFKAGYLTYTGSFAVPTSAYFVGMSTTGSVLTASLGSATTYPAGQTLIFKDIGGNAATNNILIKPSGSQTIDNATGFVIATNSGSVTLISNGTDQFYIAGSF